MDLSLSCQHRTERIRSNATRRHVVMISSAFVRLLSQGQIFHSCVSATACYSQGDVEIVTQAANTLNLCFLSFSPSNTRSNPHTSGPERGHSERHQRNATEGEELCDFAKHLCVTFNPVIEQDLTFIKTD